MKQLYVLAEKAVWTYLQGLIVLVLAGGTLNTSFTTELAIAALPAALTVIANGLPAVAQGLPFAVDLALRVARSFAAAFLGFLLSQSAFHLDASVGRAAVLAGATAAVVVVKGAIASRLGQLGTPALAPGL